MGRGFGRFGRLFGRGRRGGMGRRMGGGGGGGADGGPDQHFAIEPQDQEAVQRLQGQGVDLTKPLSLVHTFVFSSQAAADDAAGRLRKRGFEVTAEAAGATGGPRLTARMSSTVDAQSLADLRGRLTRFANHHGGSYGGWQQA
jgi:Regulator of ribonuclease activity B